MTTFLEALERVVARHGDRPAVEDEEGALSYRELWSSAGTVAGALAERGAGASSVVAVRLPKSHRAIVALAGIWRAGAVYLPLDDDAWPPARTLFVLEDSGARMVIDERFFASFVAGASSSTGSAPGVVGSEADAAYLIYTSGSTGSPKGVLVSHAGIVPILSAQIDELALGPGKRVLSMLSTAFDASLSDIGTALLSGATLVMAKGVTAAEPAHVSAILHDKRITHVDLPPSILPKLDPASLPPSLEHVVVGGEVADAESLRAWARRVRVTVAYGPTEATICTSMVRVDPEGWSRPLIGKPIAGISYRVDERSGELLIASDHGALALGYVNNPDLDRERFVELEDGRRWFRTRDRVVFRPPSADYEIAGRLDRQIKVRGVLVAPEEIEAKIAEAAQGTNVTRVAVVHRPLRSSSPSMTCARRGLVAFLEMTSEDHAQAAVDIVKARVRGDLPRVMWPQRFEIVARMPETSSGKIDFAALEQRELLAAPTVPPRDRPLDVREMILVSACEEVLGIEDVTCDDDFFALGGDSFAVLELSAAARARGLVVPPNAVYEEPVLGPLAHRLEQAREWMAASDLRALAAAAVAELPDPHDAPSSSRPRRLLLTGATGFLGSQIVRELLHERCPDRDLRIDCLVRAPSEADARRRLAAIVGSDMLARHGRVRVLAGDVAKPRLGLSEETYRALATDVTDVMHLAAQVDMVRPMAALRAANLDGTIEILRFLRLFAPKRLHYASTLSVFVATDRHEGLLREDDDLGATKRVYGGYAQTKWAAEVAVREAHRATTIHRLGLLTAAMGEDPRSNAGELTPPPQCQLTTFLRGLAEIGAGPTDDDARDLALDVTPVDFAARAMLASMFDDDKGHVPRAIHIANPSSLDLVTILASFPTALERLDKTALFRRMLTPPITEAKAILLASLARRLDARSIGHSTDLFLATNTDFDTARTTARLARAGIHCPSPQAILDAHLRYVTHR